MKAAKCSQCGCHYIVLTLDDDDDWFCPHCGSDSRSTHLKVPPDVEAAIKASTLLTPPEE